MQKPSQTTNTLPTTNIFPKISVPSTDLDEMFWFFKGSQDVKSFKSFKNFASSFDWEQKRPAAINQQDFFPTKKACLKKKHQQIPGKSSSTSSLNSGGGWKFGALVVGKWSEHGWGVTTSWGLSIVLKISLSYFHFFGWIPVDNWTESLFFVYWEMTTAVTFLKDSQIRLPSWTHGRNKFLFGHGTLK